MVQSPRPGLGRQGCTQNEGPSPHMPWGPKNSHQETISKAREEGGVQSSTRSKAVLFQENIPKAEEEAHWLQALSQAGIRDEARPDPLVGLPEALERGPGRPEVDTLFC